MRESLTTQVDAAPALLFARLVDIGRLPEMEDTHEGKG
jgi:hypothetical protein